MIINLGFYKRKPDLSHEEFSDHWTNVHAPLIRSIPDVSKYLIRYVQHHIVPEDDSLDPSLITFDGFSEAWFASVEAREEFFQLPFFQEKVIPDEEKFIDLSKTRVILLDEQRTIIRGFSETQKEWIF